MAFLEQIWLLKVRFPAKGNVWLQAYSRLEQTCSQEMPAEPLLRQVLELEPSFAEAWLCLSNVLEARGRLDEALATLGRAAEMRPELAAWCERQQGQLRARLAASSPG